MMQFRAMAAVVIACASANIAIAQATTEPPTASAPTYARERERDANGHVVGPSRVGWWNDCVFYEIFVRSFQDSTRGPLANDGIGDLRGLIERLDYLNDGDPRTNTDLGVTGIWLMPIQPTTSYHGYDVTDYYGVNPEYGTEADLRELLVQCRKRGIRVILDFVPNHSSSRHPWFVDAQDENSGRRDWYIWADQRPGYRGPWGQQVWHPQRDPRGDRRPRGAGSAPTSAASAPVDASPAGFPPATSSPASAPSGPFFYGLFGRHMPDLNYRHEAVTAEMLRATRHWLSPAPSGVGVDGLRLDAIRHLIEAGPQQDNTPETHAWLERFYADYKRAAPDAMTIGEVWASTPVAASYVGGELDLAFEFELADAMIDSINAGDARALIAAQDLVLRHFPPNQYGRFLSNHDQVRVATRLGDDPGKLRVAAALLLLGPGVPFLYYGEEVGQPGKKPDPELRTPMPWEADESVGFTQGKPWRSRFAAGKGVSVSSQVSDRGSLLSWYRRLIALRSEHRSLVAGRHTSVAASEQGVYAFLGTGSPSENDGTRLPPSAALVIVNLTPTAVASCVLKSDSAPIRGRWKSADVPLNDSVLRRLDTLHESVGGTIRVMLPTLEPHAVWVCPLELASE